MGGRYDRRRMTARARIVRRTAARVLGAAAVAALTLVLAAEARADRAYDKVAGAYAQSGGQLDACAFTQRELEAALRGIPPAIRDVVPDIRRAIEEGIAAHRRGDCRGVRPGGGASGTAGGATPPATAEPPTATGPGATAPAAPPPPPDTPTSAEPGATAPAVPPTTTPAPPGDQSAAGEPAPADERAAADSGRDLRPLVIALVVAGALLLVGLAVWGLAWLRGWDPAWMARMRHAWGEAGYRTTNTWAELVDWLRLGR